MVNISFWKELVFPRAVVLITNPLVALMMDQTVISKTNHFSALNKCIALLFALLTTQMTKPDCLN